MRTPEPNRTGYRENAAALAQMYAALCNSNASYSNSRVRSSIFGGHDSGLGFNPITHQQTRYAPYVHAGSSYHSRHTPQPPAYQSRLARLHNPYGGLQAAYNGSSQASQAYYLSKLRSGRVY